MEGTCGFHQIKSVGLDKISLHVQNLSYFCKFCFDGGDTPCDNETYVASFSLVHFKPYNASDAQVDVELVLEVEKD